MLETVASQRGVVDIGECELSDIRSAALMLGVAVLAALGPRQPAVQPFRFRAFPGNLQVAGLAAVVLYTVHGGMAVRALLLKLRMGCEALHIFSMQLHG